MQPKRQDGNTDDTDEADEADENGFSSACGESRCIYKPIHAAGYERFVGKEDRGNWDRAQAMVSVKN